MAVFGLRSIASVANICWIAGLVLTLSLIYDLISIIAYYFSYIYKIPYPGYVERTSIASENELESRKKNLLNFISDSPTFPTSTYDAYKTPSKFAMKNSEKKNESLPGIYNSYTLWMWCHRLRFIFLLLALFDTTFEILTTKLDDDGNTLIFNDGTILTLHCTINGILRMSAVATAFFVTSLFNWCKAALIYTCMCVQFGAAQKYNVCSSFVIRYGFVYLILVNPVLVVVGSFMVKFGHTKASNDVDDKDEEIICYISYRHALFYIYAVHDILVSILFGILFVRPLLMSIERHKHIYSLFGKTRCDNFKNNNNTGKNDNNNNKDDDINNVNKKANLWTDELNKKNYNYYNTIGPGQNNIHHNPLNHKSSFRFGKPISLIPSRSQQRCQNDVFRDLGKQSVQSETTRSVSNSHSGFTGTIATESYFFTEDDQTTADENHGHRQDIMINDQIQRGKEKENATEAGNSNDNNNCNSTGNENTTNENTTNEDTPNAENAENAENGDAQSEISIYDRAIINQYQIYDYHYNFQSHFNSNFQSYNPQNYINYNYNYNQNLAGSPHTTNSSHNYVPVRGGRNSRTKVESGHRNDNIDDENDDADSIDVEDEEMQFRRLENAIFRNSIGGIGIICISTVFFAIYIEGTYYQHDKKFWKNGVIYLANIIKYKLTYICMTLTYTDWLNMFSPFCCNSCKNVHRTKL